MQIPEVTIFTAPLSIVIVLLPLLSSYLLTPLYIEWQGGKNNLVLNYQGKRIVSTGGIILLVSVLLLIVPLHFYAGDGKLFWRLLLVYVSAMGLLGAIDDQWGEKECKGFKGHFKRLWQGKKFSTGLYKAAGGFLLAVSVSSRLGGTFWPDWLVKGLFLALFSNCFNLLDTRPARAAKVFFPVSLLFMFLGREHLLLLIPFWSALLIYLFWELETKIMLGDAGAYLLGGALGFYGLLILPLGMVFIFTLLFLLLHYYCEKISLSKYIEGNKGLLYLDRLGRKN
jgi:UDP-GlcNAc:undecaprenyl-phosphate GlcNAc-1-phosphate transferase